MAKTGKILKIDIASPPVHLEDPEEALRRKENLCRDIIRQAEEKAREIIANAKSEAEKEKSLATASSEEILEAAEGERETTVQTARLEVSDKTREEILNEFRPRVEKAVEDFERLLGAAQAAWETSLEKHKIELVELSLALAERIVFRISEQDAELVKKTAESALEAARDRQRIIMKVHPDDLAALEEYQVNLINRFDDLKSVELATDRRVDRGGVLIETPSGIVDGRIRTQLADLEEEVLPDWEKASKREKNKEEEEEHT